MGYSRIIVGSLVIFFLFLLKLSPLKSILLHAYPPDVISAILESFMGLCSHVY